MLEYKQQEVMQLNKTTQGKKLKFKRSVNSCNGEKDDPISSAMFFLACIGCYTSSAPLLQ